MDLSRKATKNLFSKHFPYYTQLYTNMRDVMRHLTKFGNLDADTANSLHREFIVYLLSKQRGSQFDGEATDDFISENGLGTNREYYTNAYPMMLHALKAEGILSGYPFFSALTITGDAESDVPMQITVQGMGGLQSKTTSLLTEMWAEAFNSNEKVHSNYFGGDFYLICDPTYIGAPIGRCMPKYRFSKPIVKPIMPSSDYSASVHQLSGPRIDSQLLNPHLTLSSAPSFASQSQE